nr:immunoglobulin light chain junction region [Macaca mulatta]
CQHHSNWPQLTV